MACLRSKSKKADSRAARFYLAKNHSAFSSVVLFPQRGLHTSLELVSIHHRSEKFFFRPDINRHIPPACLYTVRIRNNLCIFRQSFT